MNHVFRSIQSWVRLYTFQGDQMRGSGVFVGHTVQYKSRDLRDLRSSWSFVFVTVLYVLTGGWLIMVFWGSGPG